MKPVLPRAGVATLALIIAGFAFVAPDALAQRAGGYFDWRAATGIGAEGTGGRTSPEEAVYSYRRRPEYEQEAPSAPLYTQRRVYRYVSGAESAGNREHLRAATGTGTQDTSRRTTPSVDGHPPCNHKQPNGDSLHYPEARYYYLPGYYHCPAGFFGIFSSIAGRHRAR